MKEIQQDVKVIENPQIRMEQDLKYHIKRTDLLEEKVNTPRIATASSSMEMDAR